MDQKTEKRLQVLCVGNAGSGKTAAIKMMIEHEYPLTYLPTVGADFYTLEPPQEHRGSGLQIWDTSGKDMLNRSKRLGLEYIIRNSSIYAIFVESHNTVEQIKSEIQQWIDELGDVQREQPAQVIIVLSKADRKSEKIIDEELYDKRRDLGTWLTLDLSLPNNLKDNRLCHISALDSNTDPLKNNLFICANELLSKQKQQSPLETKEPSISSPNKFQFFPKSYLGITNEYTTVRMKLIALFDDYIINWGFFHWRHHYDKAAVLINELRPKNLDNQQCFRIISDMYQRMHRDPDFNHEGSFARRLRYALHIINEDNRPELALNIKYV